MSELGDRLVILLFAATAMALGIGYAAGFVEAEMVGLSETVFLGLLGVVFVAVLVAIWWGFDVID